MRHGGYRGIGARWTIGGVPRGDRARQGYEGAAALVRRSVDVCLNKGRGKRGLGRRSTTLAYSARIYQGLLLMFESESERKLAE